MRTIRRCSFRLAILLASCLGLAGCQPAAAPPAAPAPAAVVRAATNDAAVARAEQLVELMQARLLLMHDVARWKWNAGRPIEDLPREAELLDRMAQLTGERWQIPDQETRPFFQAQMDAGKLVQQAYFAEWEAHDIRPQFDNVPDLATEIRPRLDQISKQMLAAWHELRPDLKDQNVQSWLRGKARSLVEHGSKANGDEVRRALGEAMQSIMATPENE
ncbi:MAG: gamma subclass chorismate mutase AroQ [Pirellulales bacterium]